MSLGCFGLQATFKAKDGQDTRCVNVTQCAAGEEEARVPTTISDRVCVPCALALTYKVRRDAVIPCHPLSYAVMLLAITNLSSMQLALRQSAADSRTCSFVYMLPIWS